MPSLRTSRISYVVLGNMPATKKFVLFPGTTGSVLVFLQDGESPARLNWTNSVSAEEGGAPTRIVGAPVLQAFSMASENLAFAHGTSFADPDLRAWESLGAGGVVSDVVVWTG